MNAHWCQIKVKFLSRMGFKSHAYSSIHLKMTRIKRKNLVHFNGLKLLALDLNPRRVMASKQLAMSRLKLIPIPNAYWCQIKVKFLSRMGFKSQANSSIHLKMTRMKRKNLVHFNGFKLLLESRL